MRELPNIDDAKHMERIEELGALNDFVHLESDAMHVFITSATF